MEPLDVGQLKKRIDAIASDDEAYRKISFAYRILNVIDGKASTLLRFNAILLAIFAIFGIEPPVWKKTIYFSLILILLVSCLLAFRVVRVSWGSIVQGDDVDQQCEALVAAARRRTASYLTAWWIAIFCILALVVMLVVEVIMLYAA